MSDWTWEYDPNADERVGGLSPELRREVEQIAERLATAAAALHVGDPPVEDSGISGVQFLGEGPWLIGYLQHRWERVIYIVSVTNPNAGPH